ncbi:MAG TPA: hypothetical protein VIA82_10200 [Candidatus Limnocylindria bacterium]|jgi:uncharacterized membrane protein
MDWTLIILRILHVGSAMTWFGGAVFGALLLQPTVRALGPKAQPFMDYLVQRRRVGVFFPIVAGLTILSGAALFWRDSGGLQLSWITTPTGLAFTIGGLAGITSFVLGGILIGPSVAERTAVQNELRDTPGEPSEDQIARLARADRKMQIADRIDMPLLITAGVLMAVARYL